MRLCGVWAGESSNGDWYASGNMNAVMRLYIFPNKFKKTDSDPDYIVCLGPRNANPPSDTNDDLNENGGYYEDDTQYNPGL